MNTTKHTPGQWRTIQNEHSIDILGSDERYIGSICDDEGGLHHEESVANAQLIKASPDLLEALRCALADLEGALQARNQNDIEVHDWKAHQLSIDEAKAAIAKATGGDTMEVCPLCGDFIKSNHNCD